MAIQPKSYDVCIAGFGPVGAVLAALLGAQGRSVVVLERDQGPFPLPRAAHIDGETMRTFQALGIVEDVEPHVRPAPAYQFVSANADILIDVPAGEVGADGWFTHYMIYQPGIEKALRQRCAALPNVELRLGSRLSGLMDDGDGVTVTYNGPGGAEESLHAALLVGCDGASSLVRSLVNIELDDYGFDEPWLVLDVAVDDDSRVPAQCYQYCDPRRPVTYTPMGPGRNRWEFMILPHETPEAMMEEAAVARLLAPWGGLDGLHVERRAVYHFHGLIAREWRRGRVLLAGDSAHQMPPFAGQGMCSGIRDAANLAWKIAAALNGGPFDILLESYEQERAPHARGIVEMAIAAGRAVCTLDFDAARARDERARQDRLNGVAPPALQLPPLGKSPLLGSGHSAGQHFPQFIGPDGSRLDDVLGQGPWLIEHRGTGEPKVCVGQIGIDHPALAPFADDLSAWFDQNRASGAVLVRPDRVIFDTGTPGALWSAWTERVESPARHEVS
ncbi:bifunctional 3-(3-hydroxy-phenyl)propionate/3-hydroxycinnamic acid hydroxylase MhpA [Sphingobium sp. Leaf26]|uniref:bifunctional 3-(3-hydroxy-phenyl)propionate/3-hydroxycinnamic acid hydroxylase MhpA n=1 Tax=Sphingobium sp. Leaf26 TaxID=1735693 RepID=UPI000A409C27|nr:bifunctional 3-(3-hydroxy-phenyl)propionate/3-hydroxycinnamic acid hydroxylase [Sphingobium sp. Leaf26]